MLHQIVFCLVGADQRAEQTEAVAVLRVAVAVDLEGRPDLLRQVQTVGVLRDLEGRAPAAWVTTTSGLKRRIISV